VSGRLHSIWCILGNNFQIEQLLKNGFELGSVRDTRGLGVSFELQTLVDQDTIGPVDVVQIGGACLCCSSFV
jgi:hypothetical protein